jgi:hypothetical protein
MNKYERLRMALEEHGTGKMKCFGYSMEPKLKTGGTLTFEKRDEYHVGDIVFSKVNGRYIDAHQVTKKDARGRYLISNNKGWDNGWTTTIYGKAVFVEYDNKQGHSL